MQKTLKKTMLRAQSVPPAERGGPLFLCPAHAGWPSPAEDYIEGKLDLHNYIVKNEAATFFLNAAGDSMTGAGIYDGDLLVVDRSLAPGHGRIVIAAVDGELTIKRLHKRGRQVLLLPENAAYPAIDISEREDAILWGVVTHAIHKV